MSTSLGASSQRRINVQISGLNATDNAKIAAGVFTTNITNIYSNSEQASPVSASEQNVANALFLTDPLVDRESLISTKGRRVNGTCEWITRKICYQSWLRGDTQLMWITGGPGKGKTMISVFLTEELEGATQNMENAETIFYFCNHQDEKRNTAVAILRGLLQQIITKLPKFAKHALPYFATTEKTEVTLSSLETLWIIFERIVRDVELVGTIYCVLDGLDECDEPTTRVLIPKLVYLFDSESSPVGAQNFKLIVVSRDIPALRTCARVSLDPDVRRQVATDIERFVSARVTELENIDGFSDKFRTMVEQSLLKRSEGTFLWVGFVMHELSQKTTSTEVLEALQDLPKGLHAMYGRMLLQIDKNRRIAVSSILRWVTMAFRPLSLRELAAAVGIQSSVIPAEQAIRDQVALCGPFLGVHEQFVRLVHPSAGDYLLRSEADNSIELADFRFRAEEAHLVLARACISCIEHSSLKHKPLAELNDETCAGESPLFRYAVRHWPDHAKGSSVRARELLSHSLFEPQSKLRERWWNVAYPGLTLPHLYPSSLLHLASWLGISPWIKPLVIRKWWMVSKPVDKQDENGYTALHWAARNGHDDAVRELIELDATIDKRCNKGGTAFRYAASQVHEGVVQRLVSHGADVNAKDRNGWTTLLISVGAKDDAVMRLLLQLHADLNITNAEGRTPLHFAAGLGLEEFTQLLLESGAEHNIKDKCGYTPLHVAIGAYHETTARLLLKFGAYPNVQDRLGCTPLHYAAGGGQEAIVQLLLKHRVDANIKNHFRKAALDFAILKGHGTVVQPLLELGVDTKVTEYCGGTLLHFAASAGDERVMQLLVNHGIDPNIGNRSGQTPLHITALAGHEALAQMLLNLGVEADAKRDDGYTPLHYAARAGHERVARVLANHGADVSMKSNRG
ncbi:hypothetical protein ACLOAV_010616 [Pseudogymnoascus australis]